jgi:hypothetical protein
MLLEHEPVQVSTQAETLNIAKRVEHHSNRLLKQLIPYCTYYNVVVLCLIPPAHAAMGAMAGAVGYSTMLVMPRLNTSGINLLNFVHAMTVGHALISIPTIYCYVRADSKAPNPIAHGALIASVSGLGSGLLGGAIVGLFTPSEQNKQWLMNIGYAAAAGCLGNVCTLTLLYIAYIFCLMCLTIPQCKDQASHMYAYTKHKLDRNFLSSIAASKPAEQLQAEQLPAAAEVASEARGSRLEIVMV